MTENTKTRDWRARFLWGWGILTLLTGAFTLFYWLASWIAPSASNTGILIALLWVLSLIWLTVFLEDLGIPLAILIAALVWLIYSTFEVNAEAGVPQIVAGGCLMGGLLGGMVGGILRKWNQEQATLSLMLTAIGSLLGFILGYGVILLFSWMLWT